MKIAGLLIATAVLGAGTHVSAETPWPDAVARIIAKRQSYPRSAEIRGDQGTTRVKIFCNSDGAIARVQLTQSSGSPILDRQAQEVIANIGRLPPPPEGVTTLLVPIVWRLN